MSTPLLMIMPPLGAVLLQSALLIGFIYLLIMLFRDNRLLFYCLLSAMLAHVSFAGVLWGMNYFKEEQPEMIRINIAAFKRITEKPKKIILPKTLDLPLGRPDGKRNVTKMPKGSNLKDRKTGGKNQGDGKPRFVGRTLYDEITADGTMPVDPGLSDLTGSAGEVGAKDIRGLGTGGGGGDFGTPDGEGGEIPAGFVNGKKGGRVYFIRLKHGTGAWNKYAEGTRRLLSFLNGYFPCQGDSWPMTAGELNDKYLKKGSQPSFLYLYCDDNFRLSSSEVTILRSYLNKGGFLFLDSAPDPAARSKVTVEMQRVLPGERLADLSRGHKVNSFLFTLGQPGIGSNILTGRNYGISRGGKLAVFYSMGDLSLFYETLQPNSDPYALAQYQMGANVMLYAINHGNDSDMAKRKGADARITESVVDLLTKMSGGGSPTKSPDTPEESVKIKPPVVEGDPPPGSEDLPIDPDEIKLID